MLRRSFLKGLFAAPAVSKELAREAVKESAGVIAIGPPPMPMAYSTSPLHVSKSQTLAAQIEEIKRYLTDTLSAASKEQFIQENSISTLDPDLAANKSMAVHTLIRIQQERHWERYKAYQTARMNRRILKLTEESQEAATSTRGM